ncbi:MAG: SoxR reducing system RseC family protein [Betaproteobacteria bacterium]|nr:SoxR reducing system RseC family protein [Betaproteobacteria bacterium]
MNVRDAVVVEIHAGEALLRVSENAGCGRCETAGGCRSGMLTELFGQRCSTYRVAAAPGVQVGNVVQVSIPEGGVLWAVGLVYGLPLIGLFVGAITAERLAWSAASSALAALFGAMLGFALGLFVSRLRKARRALTVRILDRCEAEVMK